MFFTRTRRYKFSVPQEDVKNRLIGKHVKIHNLDFEVYEQELNIKIAPHAEDLPSIKTLPIMDVDMSQDGNTTEVVITSNIRTIDYGGPLLVMLFCGFLLFASIVLFLVGGERHVTYTMFGVCIVVFATFWVRMEMGYFDYVRKLQAL